MWVHGGGWVGQGGGAWGRYEVRGVLGMQTRRGVGWEDGPIDWSLASRDGEEGGDGCVGVEGRL